MKLRMKTALGMSLLSLAITVPITGCGDSNSTATPAAVPVTIALARTPVPAVDQMTTQTASYRVELWTGPTLTMMMASFPIMSSTDQGQLVNRHLEVHIYDKSSGAKLTDIVPLVRLTHRETGVSRDLAGDQETGSSLGVSFLTACQISKHRAVEPHFGDNIYLQEGTYSVIIDVAGEAAEAEITF